MENIIDILTGTKKELLNLIARTFPQLYEYARNNDLNQFVKWIKDTYPNNNKIKYLLCYEGATIDELSSDTKIKIETIKLLWEAFNNIDNSVTTDFLYDIFMLLNETYSEDKIDLEVLKQFMQRFPAGIDRCISEKVEANKHRIIGHLIKKLEHKDMGAFKLDPSISYEAKYEIVNGFWNNYKFHLALAIKSPSELYEYLNGSISDKSMEILYLAEKKGIPFFITPYYASLMCVDSSYDDYAIRSYVIYSESLVKQYGNIKAWEKEDLIEDNKPNAAGWILPYGSNIHRRYPEVAIVIPDSMGRACGGLCASCQRMYNFQKKNLNFDLEKLKPKDSWNVKLERLMGYFEEDTQLRDILITGGDALMSQNKTLENILNAVYNMAKRKKNANLERQNGKKLAEITRIRLGSRLPAYLPMRFDDELLSILTRFKAKGEEIGITQFVIQTHFQTPLEVTDKAIGSINKILKTGWIITNQLVYNVAASRIGQTAKLREVLTKAGVLCYYTFTVKGFEENSEVYAPLSRSMQETMTEKIYGKLTCDQQKSLVKLIEEGEWSSDKMKLFLSENNLPFVSTDRSVLNLPGIGKSMDFKVIGIDKSGRRIMRFSHDATRKHSPIIENMGEVYIIENKSIMAYLKQLNDIGENVEYYKNIYNYTSGKSEERFSLYEHRPYDYDVDENLNNYGLSHNSSI